MNTKASSEELLLNFTCCNFKEVVLFVVVRKTVNIPLFDKRFVNYGYNNQECVEHLRYKGYEFKVFRDGFLIEVPHIL